MKRILFLFCISCFLMFSVNGQKIKENVIDEFTGKAKTTTSVLILCSSMKINVYYQFKRIDGGYWLNFRLSLNNGSVFSVENDAPLMLKLQNDSIITLKNKEYTITTKGGGAMGLMGSGAMGANLNYNIPDEYIQPLTTLRVIKIRVYTTDGYMDKEINEDSADKFKKSLKLLYQTDPPERQDKKF